MKEQQSENHEFQFQGSWWPPELWDYIIGKTISLSEAVVLMLIDGLVKHNQEGKDCWASNEWIGGRLGLQEQAVSRMISNLKKVGLLVQTGFDGRSRYLRPIWSRVVKSDGAGWSKTTRLNGRKRLPENTKREYEENIPDADASGRVCESNKNGFGLTAFEESSNPTLVSSGLFQQMFFKRWEGHYKKPYAMTAPRKEMALLKNIHRALGGDAAEFGRVLDRFFANDKQFFLGHSIPKLHQELNQFRVTSTDDNGEPSAEESVPAGRLVFSGKTVQGDFEDSE